MQIKTTMRSHLTLDRMLSSINQQTTSAGKDVEEGETFGTVGGNADYCSHCGKQYRDASILLKNLKWALADMAQWIEFWPVNQKVTGSICSQGTCLSLGPGPQWRVHKKQPHIDVSLLLFLPPFSSL